MAERRAAMATGAGGGRAAIAGGPRRPALAGLRPGEAGRLSALGWGASTCACKRMRPYVDEKRMRRLTHCEGKLVLSEWPTIFRGIVHARLQFGREASSAWSAIGPRRGKLGKVVTWQVAKQQGII